MPNIHQQNCYKEFEQLMTSVKFDNEFTKKNKNKIKQIFSRIYTINMLKNRPEVKAIFDNEFDMTFTLLLESSYSLFSAQSRASLLLLRSSLEATLKFVTEKERNWIINLKGTNIEFQPLNYRFVETSNSLLNDIKIHVSKDKYPEYYKTIERSVTYYKQLCSIVHSNGVSIPVGLSYFYDELNENTLINKEEFFKLYISSLDTIFTLLYFLLRNSLVHWDTYELSDILSVMFKDNKKQRYLNYIKF